MVNVRIRGEAIRRFLLENVSKHPTDVAKVAAEHFKISRQAVNKHLKRLVSERALLEEGNTRQRSYKLAALVEWRQTYLIANDLAEDAVWRADILPVLGSLPQNVLDIWQYGFTEMFNNAKDHSEGSGISVKIKKTAITTQMFISDNGIGIFKKIQLRLGLLDERHAILELSKGKLTTDPQRHSGEGIFFTSRMFDNFYVLSGSVYFSHKFDTPEDWILEGEEIPGTFVQMLLNNHTARRMKKVFDSFATGDDGFQFNKTIVPVALAQYGDDKLISRSQAKRLLSRVELFKTVIFDFERVPTIGQAFADEIFRVFSNAHPEIDIFAAHENSEVKRMIMRAKSGDKIVDESTDK